MAALRAVESVAADVASSRRTGRTGAGALAGARKPVAQWTRLRAAVPADHRTTPRRTRHHADGGARAERIHPRPPRRRTSLPAPLEPRHMNVGAVICDIYGTLLEVGPAPADADKRWARLWRQWLGAAPRGARTT